MNPMTRRQKIRSRPMDKLKLVFNSIPLLVQCPQTKPPKSLGPEHMDCRPMDKLDLVFIPFLYLFRTTILLISIALHFIPTPLKIWTVLCNSITWTAVFSLHMILFVLSALHRLTQIRIIQIPLNMI